MKQQFFIVVLLVACIQVNAQTEKGNFMAGGGARIDANDRTFSVTVNPTLGCFFVNNFAGGLTTDLGYSSTREHAGTTTYHRDVTTLGAGPFLRYYFSTARIRPFIDGNTVFTTHKTEGHTTTTTSSGATYFVAPGAAFFLNHNVALEARAGYRHVADEHQVGSGGFAYRMGLQVYLNGGKRTLRS